MRTSDDPDTVRSRPHTAFSLVLAIFLVATPAVSAGMATDTVSETLLASGPLAQQPEVLDEAEGQTDWLLIQDNVLLGWFIDPIPGALDDGDYSWDRITSDQVEETDLSQYDGIYIPSDQNSEFHFNLIDVHEDREATIALEEYVIDGGTLVANLAQLHFHSRIAIPPAWVPGCPIADYPEDAWRDEVVIEDPDSPVVENLTSEDLSGWSQSANGLLTNLPSTANVVIASTQDEPIMASYPLGLGHVYVTTQNVEKGYYKALDPWWQGPPEWAYLLENQLALDPLPDPRGFWTIQEMEQQNSLCLWSVETETWEIQDRVEEMLPVT